MNFQNAPVQNLGAGWTVLSQNLHARHLAAEGDDTAEPQTEPVLALGTRGCCENKALATSGLQEPLIWDVHVPHAAVKQTVRWATADTPVPELPRLKPRTEQ